MLANKLGTTEQREQLVRLKRVADGLGEVRSTRQAVRHAPYEPAALIVRRRLDRADQALLGDVAVAVQTPDLLDQVALDADVLRRPVAGHGDHQLRLSRARPRADAEAEPQQQILD